MLKQDKSRKFLTILTLAAFFAAGYFYLNLRKPSDNLQVSDSEIRFAGKLLETSETLPYMFLEEGLKLDDNAKYTYSTLGSHDSENQLLRVDKLVYDAASYSSRVAVFYLYNSNNREYKRVLQSTKEQNEARYPETEIISQYPLTVRFYYDVSRPLGCYGLGCRSYWADHFRWDSGQEKFVEVNGEFASFYKNLQKDYERLNSAGCDLGNVEGRQLRTLEQVYNSSNVNYCKDTTGNELNKRGALDKFFNYKKKLLNLVNNNQSNTENPLAKYFPLQKGNFWEYEGIKKETQPGGAIETANVKKKVEVIDVQESDDGTIVNLDGGSDYLIKGNDVYSRESWGDELRFSFPLYVGQKWGDEESLRYRDDDAYVWRVEEKFSRQVLGKEYDECFKINYKSNSDTSFYIFCYGLGIVEYDYKHNGTVSEWNHRLVKTNVD